MSSNKCGIQIGRKIDKSGMARKNEGTRGPGDVSHVLFHLTYGAYHRSLFHVSQKFCKIVREKTKALSLTTVKW